MDINIYSAVVQRGLAAKKRAHTQDRGQSIVLL